MSSEYLIRDTVILAAKTAAQILISGGEISRAEDSARRICNAYGIKNASVFALNSVVIVTCDSKADAFTHSIRIHSVQESMQRLEAINEFSRNICSLKPSVKFANTELDKICLHKPDIAKAAFGAIITAASFTLFYGGTLADFIVTSALAALIFYGNGYIDRITANPLMPAFILSLVCGLITLTAVQFGLCSNFETVMLGCLMQLFPGISLINSASSLLSNNTISAILQLTQSILTAFFIAAGFALSIYIWQTFLY